MELKINPEFHDLIPPLTADERRDLESNLIADGCLDALKTWDGYIIDGHNRYEICKRNNIHFEVDELEFDDESDAKIWIIKNQIGRRNLDLIDRNVLGDALKPLIAAKAKEQQVRKPESVYPELEKQKPIDTLQEVSSAIGVGHSTRGKYERIMKQAPEEIKQKMLNKESTINGAYQEAFEVVKEPPTLDTERVMTAKVTKEDREFIKQMAKKEPPTSGPGKCSDNIIITEFDEIVKEFRAKINKFLYMPSVFSEMTEIDSPIQNLISASDDIEKIMGMIKGVKL